MIQTIRPTMSMVRDLLPWMKESWIFNDCAIGETKYGEFVGLVVVRFDEGWQMFLGVFARFRVQSFVEGATATREEYSQRGHRDCFSEFHIVYI